MLNIHKICNVLYSIRWIQNRKRILFISKISLFQPFIHRKYYFTFGTFAETLYYVRTWSDNITYNYYPSTINTTISYSFHQCVHSYYNRCTDINILSTNAWYDRSTVSPHTSLDKISDTHDRFSHFHLYCWQDQLSLRGKSCWMKPNY